VWNPKHITDEFLFLRKMRKRCKSQTIFIACGNAACCYLEVCSSKVEQVIYNHGPLRAFSSTMVSPQEAAHLS